MHIASGHVCVLIKLRSYLFSDVDCYVSEGERDDEPRQDVVVIANQPSTAVQQPPPRKVTTHGHTLVIRSCKPHPSILASSHDPSQSSCVVEPGIVYDHVAKRNAHAYTRTLAFGGARTSSSRSSTVLRSWRECKSICQAEGAGENYLWAI